MKQPKWNLPVGTMCLILLAIVLASPALGQTAIPSQATPPSPGEPSPSPALVPPVSVERAIMGPDYSGCGGDFAPVVNAAYEQEVLDLVNEIRASYSLPPLKLVSMLEEASRYHAADMAQDNYFDHDTYDRVGGSLTYVCEWSSRIMTYYPSWWSLAENIAAGYSTPESVMAGWMSSSGHRANILSTGNWEIGVGYYEGGGAYYRYWVQDFGRRGGVYPLIINGDAAETESTDVSLYIYGEWEEIRLRNDEGAWSAWMPFQSTMDWTLQSVGGERTVHAEMRTGSESATSSDTIYLNAALPALGNLPDELLFAYSIADMALSPASHTATPLNVGNDEALTWTLSQEGTWFAVTPSGGTTPASFEITPTDFDTGTVGVYSGAVIVTVTDPPGTAGSPHRIDLTLRVVEGPFRYIFLPLIQRD
jgi:uncharacterized protein YkwD